MRNKHYEEMKLQPIEVIDWLMKLLDGKITATQAHYISSAIKYAMRQGRKEGTDDAAKARVYMEWAYNNQALIEQSGDLPKEHAINQHDDTFVDDFGNAYLPNNEYLWATCGRRLGKSRLFVHDEYSWHEVEDKNAELKPDQKEWIRQVLKEIISESEKELAESKRNIGFNVHDGEVRQSSINHTVQEIKHRLGLDSAC